MLNSVCRRPNNCCFGARQRELCRNDYGEKERAAKKRGIDDSATNRFPEKF
jgi:hypothetical protein